MTEYSNDVLCVLVYTNQLNCLTGCRMCGEWMSQVSVMRKLMEESTWWISVDYLVSEDILTYTSIARNQVTIKLFDT